jgi:hypothetical protein
MVEMSVEMNQQGHVIVRHNLLIPTPIVGYVYLFFCYALP